MAFASQAPYRFILATADVRMAEMLRANADLVLLKPISPAQLRPMAYRLRPQEPQKPPS